MSAAAAAGRSPSEVRRVAAPAASPWPHEASHAGTMTIGAVLAVLQTEYPAVTVSKLRFLEEQGLVTPTRTGAGYRKYSQADVERLRYALKQQRDHYLPLKVIKEQLDELDAGHDVPELRTARVVARDGQLVLGSGRLTARELAELSGVAVAEVDGIVQAGILVPDSRGRFGPRSVEVVQLVTRLGAEGLELRHLRGVRQSAAHMASLVEQLVAAERARKTGVAQERAAAHAAEIGQNGAKLYATILRLILDDELG